MSEKESKQDLEAARKQKREESLKILGHADFAITLMAAAYMQDRNGTLVSAYGTETKNAVMDLLKERFSGNASDLFKKEFENVKEILGGDLAFEYRTNASTAELASGLARVVQESLLSITVGDYVKALGVKADGISEEDKGKYFIDYARKAEADEDEDAGTIVNTLRAGYIQHLYSSVRKQILDAETKKRKGSLEELLNPKKEAKK